MVGAANGLEAIEGYTQHKIDLILMDIHLPKMDGIEATKRIRELESNSTESTPILALTGGMLPEEEENFLAAGVDGIVDKPIDFQLLFKTMKQLLDA